MCRWANNNLVCELEHTGCAAMWSSCSPRRQLTPAYWLFLPQLFFCSVLLLYDFELTSYKHSYSLHNCINDTSWSSDIAVFSLLCHKWRHMISSQKTGPRLTVIFFSWVESDWALWTLQPDSTRVEFSAMLKTSKKSPTSWVQLDHKSVETARSDSTQLA